MAEGEVLNFSGLRAQRKLAVLRDRETKATLQSQSCLGWGFSLAQTIPFTSGFLVLKRKNVIDTPKCTHEKCTQKKSLKHVHLLVVRKC